MLRRVSAAAVAAAVVAASTVLLLGESNAPAWADCPPDPINVSTGLCLSDTVPSTPPTTTDPGPSPDSEPSGPACQGAPNGECTNEYGFVWIGPPRNCYGFALDPQPKAGDPLWHGHDPSEGGIWSCDPTFSVPQNTWFVPNGQTVIDPGGVARQLVKRAPFELANAQMAPPPNYHSYINYLNWLWIPQSQWHGVSVSLTAAGATVTLTAKPTYVLWDMGNGESTSCAGSGRAWVTGMPEDAPTNCAFRYSTMQDAEGDTWTISARITYAVGWTCVGNCGGQTAGDLGDVTAPAGAPTSITVLQRQTVVTH